MSLVSAPAKAGLQILRCFFQMCPSGAVTILLRQDEDIPVRLKQRRQEVVKIENRNKEETR